MLHEPRILALGRAHAFLKAYSIQRCLMRKDPMRGTNTYARLSVVYEHVGNDDLSLARHLHCQLHLGPCRKSWQSHVEQFDSQKSHVLQAGPSRTDLADNRHTLASSKHTLLAGFLIGAVQPSVITPSSRNQSMFETLVIRELVSQICDFKDCVILASCMSCNQNSFEILEEAVPAQWLQHLASLITAQAP